MTASAATADAPLLVAEDVVHPSSAGPRAAAWAAEVSGGAVVTSLDDLVGRVGSLEGADVERPTRPMRSPWWILPFAGLLSAEWALRRRGGQP